MSSVKLLSVLGLLVVCCLGSITASNLIVNINSAADHTYEYTLTSFMMDGHQQERSNTQLTTCSITGYGNRNTKVTVVESSTGEQCSVLFQYTTSYSGSWGAYAQLSPQVSACRFPYQASYKLDGSTVYLTLTYGGANGVVNDSGSQAKAAATTSC